MLFFSYWHEFIFKILLPPQAGGKAKNCVCVLICTLCRPELGKSLNTDEAIALGAVYQGAGHTKLFRVKKFIVKEGTLFPIQVRHSYYRVLAKER